MKAQMKIFSTVLSLVFLAISFLISQPAIAQQQDERVYVKIDVDGLSCPFCAYGLEKKLKEVKKTKDVHIDIKGAFTTFNVAKENKPTEEELKKLVKDAGFTARKISFSATPIESDDEK